jgi:hypothetical protein
MKLLEGFWSGLRTVLILSLGILPGIDGALL